MEIDRTHPEVAAGLVRGEPARLSAGSLFRRVDEAPRPADGPLRARLADEQPRISGRELAERLATTRPTMRLLHMSGYTPDDVLRHDVLEGSVEFLQKPFTPAVLAARVRDVLGKSLDAAA